MENNIKYPMVGGVISTLIFGFMELLLYYTCTNNLACLFLLSIPILPGILLGLERYGLVLVSIFIWFLLGSLIGFLVYKVKKK